MKFNWVILSTFLFTLNCRKVTPEAPSEGYGVPASSTLGTTGATSSSSIGKNTANATSPMGMQLSSFGATNSEWISIDPLLQAGDWQALACDAQPADATNDSSGVPMNTDGWVIGLPANSCVGARVFQGARGDYPKGRYLIKYAGNGSLSISGDANSVIALDAGLAAFDVETPTSAGVLLKIESVRGSDPLRQIQIISPGGVCGRSKLELDPLSYCQTDRGGTGTCAAGLSCYDFSDVIADRFSTAGQASFVSQISNGAAVFFHPVFLTSLQAYRALGFKRWLAPTAFSNTRTALSSNIAHFSAGQGAPWELALALANALQADAWLTIPVDSPDASLSSMARMFAQNLDDNLAVYVDYAGEFWVPNSDTRIYLENQATAMSQPSFEDSYALRASSVASIWQQAFSSVAKGNARVHIVGSVDAADTQMPERIQTALHSSNIFSILATSMRFDIPLANGTTAADMTQLFDSISADAPTAKLNEARARALLMVNEAKKLGLKLVAYGSGYALSPALTVNDARESTRNDTRMNTVTSRNLANWKAAGGELIMHDKSADDTNADPSTPWGALSSQQDTTSEISQALQDFITTNACWWTGCERN